MSTTLDAPGIDPVTGHVRRSVWGRLYHGETAIDFYRQRKFWLILSSVLIVASLVSLFTRGLNLGLDFKGGVAWSVETDTLTEDQARAVLDANGVSSAAARITEKTSANGKRSLEVQVGDQPEAVRVGVQDALAKAAGVDLQSVDTNSVSATWGRSITEKAVKALIVFLLLVALFISWRLEWKMALAAISAVVHDVLVSVGIYSLFGFVVTPATVVAFLTILGFSLYDTIVVFDKVRENAARYSGTRAPYADVMNVSMNQVLMRSLNTSLAAVLPVLSLLVLGSWVLGATTLSEFAVALLVGLITGSYSSIFIASPLLTILKEREPRYAALTGHHATGADLERLVLGASPSVVRRDGRAGVRAPLPAGATVPAVGAAVRPSMADAPASEALTHPPRPRTKKRRPAG